MSSRHGMNHLDHKYPQSSSRQQYLISKTEFLKYLQRPVLKFRLFDLHLSVFLNLQLWNKDKRGCNVAAGVSYGDTAVCSANSSGVAEASTTPVCHTFVRTPIAAESPLDS